MLGQNNFLIIPGDHFAIKSKNLYFIKFYQFLVYY